MIKLDKNVWAYIVLQKNNYYRNWQQNKTKQTNNNKKPQKQQPTHTFLLNVLIERLLFNPAMGNFSIINGFICTFYNDMLHLEQNNPVQIYL